jgi:glycosyltransferase involved in cell wall biosynthesis
MSKPVEKIKVAHVIARVNVGGAALHVMHLAGKLCPPEHPDFESHLYCGYVGRGEADMSYVAEGLGVPMTYIPELVREVEPRNDWTAFWKLYRAFRHEKPLVVHTNTSKAGFLGRTAARLAGVPVVLHTFHGHVFEGYFSKRKTEFFIMLERLCARLTDHIVVMSAELKRQFIEVYHLCEPERILLENVGFDLQLFAAYKRQNSTFRQTFNIPESTPLVALIGRFVPIKNHDLFLQAAALVHAQRPEVQFVLIGDGERRAEIEALVTSLNLDTVVTFTGWVRDVHAVYAALDCFVLSSKNEGLPVSMIEAMAAKVPVVSTNVGGVRDLIIDSTYGALIPPDDAEALAAGILRALDKDGLNLEQTQRHVLETYDISVVAQTHAEIYKRLLRKKGYAV